MFHFSRCWSCFQSFNLVADTVYSLIQGYSVCHRCAGRPCFDWGKRVFHKLFLVPKTYYSVIRVVFIQVTPYVNLRFFQWHNAPSFCKYYRMQPRQHDASEWLFFLSCFSPFALQIFYFIGFGLFCVETLISIWVIQVWLHFLKFQIILSTCTQLTNSLFHCLPYSKYTCTSVAVVRLLRWNERLLEEH